MSNKTHIKLDFKEALYVMLNKTGSNLKLSITQSMINEFFKQEILPRVTDKFVDLVKKQVEKEIASRAKHIIQEYKEMLSRAFLDPGTGHWYHNANLKERIVNKIQNVMHSSCQNYYKEKSKSDIERIKKEVKELYTAEQKQLVEETLKKYIDTRVSEIYKKKLLGGLKKPFLKEA